MKRHIREARRSYVDIDDVYDEFERQGVHYEATKVARVLDEISWRINTEDVPLCLVALYTHGVNLNSVTTVTYDEDEFAEWLEHDQDEFDGGYQVYMLPGLPRRYFGWYYGDSEITELYIQKKITFSTEKL